MISIMKGFPIKKCCRSPAVSHLRTAHMSDTWSVNDLSKVKMNLLWELLLVLFVSHIGCKYLMNFQLILLKRKTSFGLLLSLLRWHLGANVLENQKVWEAILILYSDLSLGECIDSIRRQHYRFLLISFCFTVLKYRSAEFAQDLGFHLRKTYFLNQSFFCSYISGT